MSRGRRAGRIRALCQRRQRRHLRLGGSLPARAVAAPPASGFSTPKTTTPPARATRSRRGSASTTSRWGPAASKRHATGFASRRRSPIHLVARSSLAPRPSATRVPRFASVRVGSAPSPSAPDSAASACARRRSRRAISRGSPMLVMPVRTTAIASSRPTATRAASVFAIQPRRASAASLGCARGDLYCDITSFTCRRFGAFGEACDPAVPGALPCDPAWAVCDGVCRPRPGLGEACNDSDRLCVPTTRCDFERDVCVALAAVGEACESSDECQRQCDQGAAICQPYSRCEL